MTGFKKDYHADKAIKRIRGTIFGYFITHFRIVTLIIAAIFLLGIFSLMNLPRESDPEVKIPIAIVSTYYAGASPADVESLITDEIENKLEELDDVKLITSSSRTSLSSIVVEFEASADLEASISELKDKVGDVVGLPGEAEDPVVTQIRANDFAIITFSLSGDLTETQLKILGETVQHELESISGVSKVPVLGIRDKEYSVLVNRAALSRLNISISSIVGAIRVANLDMPLGDIVVDGINYNLRTVAKFQSIDDLKNTVVTQSDGNLVLLKDVAEVKEQFEDHEFISRMSVSGTKAQNTVSLQVFKKTGGNILDIVDSAKDRIKKLQDDKIIPANVKVEINNDYSSFIRDDLNTLGSSGLQSTMLIFVIMFIALSFKEALIALFAIPMTFFITFIVLYFTDSTLNSMTLYALVLSLGLLVDSFIIILEGIFHNIREGYSAVKAGLLSVANYSKPLTSGMLTTVAAFFPMLLVSGILGEYLRIFPITIAIVLLSSLFVSLILVPSFSSKFLAKSKIDVEMKESILERYATNKLRKIYRNKITKFLQNKKAKLKFSFAITGLFIASLGLLIFGIVPVELFPKIDTNFVYIDIEMPIGTELDKTAEVATQVEEKFYSKPYIKNFVTTIGQSSSIGAFEAGSSSEHLASISINLVDEELRDKKSFEITEQLREELKEINQGEITIQELSAGPPTGSPIEARILGEDLVILDDLANKTKQVLKNIEGTLNIDSDQEVSPADLTFTLNKDTIARLGLTVSDVSLALRTAIFGVTATEVSLNGDDFNVVVKLDKDKISSVEEIKNLSLVNNFGQEIKFSSLANFSLEPALASIRHRDNQRTISVSSDVEVGYTASDIVSQAEKNLDAIGIPNGYSISFGGEVEDIEQSFTELWYAMIVAVILIALILVLQFDSYIRPIIVMMNIPLMLIGVVFGMLIFDLPFSFPVFLGLISLAGIVVNDAIVLMDKTKRNIEERNMNSLEAVADAGDTRLQPILLTSVTTIMGVVPLAFASEFWVGLSVSIIFGLLFATIFQLFVVPMLFLRFEGRRIDRKKAEAEKSKIEYQK
ncbi:MAG: efflux RND transporter permease subunit [Patescibacteria group bacterium]|jgi:HAE1 family hydrophobic/amphiphilic exporter-1